MLVGAGFKPRNRLTARVDNSGIAGEPPLLQDPASHFGGKSAMLQLDSLISDFPILDQTIQGRPLVYLDNAATTQKPMAVLLASRHYYEAVNSNIHRGTHYLARLATEAFEKARQTVASHLNAGTPDEIIFTSGTTDGINLVANVLALSGRIQPGDEILISTLEHHSNIVPWQMLCERTGGILKIIPCHEDGSLDQEAFVALLNERTKVLSLTWISNSFGTVNPIAEMTSAAKKAGALVMIDAAQATAHMHIDVQGLGIDFLALSGHKVYAPTGIGVLWGRADLLNSLPPWRGGGEMIKEVTFEKTTYNELPFKYEAGTPNIEGAIALAAALDFLNGVGLSVVRKHERELIRSAADALSSVPGIRFFGPDDRAGALSFNVEGVHQYDLGTLMDQMGVAVRTGHHCCQPLMARFGITGTVRASFALYNTEKDVEALAEAVSRSVAMLR
jgi:cysteine desulfurase/selenocysteine lyase